MLIVSPRGVNCRVWFHFGCSGQKVDVFMHEGIFYGYINLKKKQYAVTLCGMKYLHFFIEESIRYNVHMMSDLGPLYIICTPSLY